MDGMYLFLFVFPNLLYASNRQFNNILFCCGLSAPYIDLLLFLYKSNFLIVFIVVCCRCTIEMRSLLIALFVCN